MTSVGKVLRHFHGHGEKFTDVPANRFCIIQRAHRRSSFFSRPTRWAIAVLSFLCLSAGCVQRVLLLFYVRPTADRPHTIVAKGKLTMLYYTQRQPSGHNRICSEKKPHDQLHTAKQQAVHTS